MAGTERKHVGTLPVRILADIVDADSQYAFLLIDGPVKFVDTVGLVYICLGKERNKCNRVIDCQIDCRIIFFLGAQPLFIDPAGESGITDQRRNFFYHHPVIMRVRQEHIGMIGLHIFHTASSHSLLFFWRILLMGPHPCTFLFNSLFFRYGSPFSQ